MSFRLQDQSRIVAQINQELTKIRTWFFDNQLLLNPDKTKLLVCGSKLGAAKTRNVKLLLLGKQLVPVEAARVFGVTLDTSLTFDDHVNATVASCMSRLGQKNRVKHCFDNHTLIPIIHTIVFSTVTFFLAVQSGAILHNLTLPNSKLFRIFPVESLVAPILRQLNWLPVKQHMYYRDSITAFMAFY